MDDAKVRENRKVSSKARKQFDLSAPQYCPICDFGNLTAPCQYRDRIYCGRCQQYHFIQPIIEGEGERYERVCVGDCERCRGYELEQHLELRKVIDNEKTDNNLSDD